LVNYFIMGNRSALCPLLYISCNKRYLTSWVIAYFIFLNHFKIFSTAILKD